MHIEVCIDACINADADRRTALPLFARADDGAPPPMPPPHGDGMPPHGDGDGPRGDGPHDGAPFFGPGMDDGAPPFLRGLELSEAQQDKVFAILHAEAPYLRDQSKVAEKSHAALRAMSDGGAYDDAKAIASAQAGAQAMANIMLQHLRSEQKILALLTPEQRKQMADDQQQRQQHQHHPGHPPQP
ncbi:Spy/CpxP family protein refolding chaperone [Rugamonas sp.]|uniref:Spy/CpxP family protein refolding chaperone n=1 Tax=Rugamonas sp. TaxID=1926287 RepID=UPI0025E514AC|nr:Spy/CpxP family protein refolding chaperone [Rugamonas sp.]